MADQEQLIGSIGVDAGIVVIGDPCYLVAGAGSRVPKWQEVVDQLLDPENPRRIEGTSGVVVEGTIMTKTPKGDGRYPVYADLDEAGQIVALRVDFRLRV